MTAAFDGDVDAGWGPRPTTPAGLPRIPTRLDPPLYHRAITRELEAISPPDPEEDDDRRPLWWPVLVAVLIGVAVGLGWLVLVTLRPPAIAGEATVRVDRVVAETLVAERVVAATRWITTVSTTLVLGGVIFRLFVAGQPVGEDGPARPTLRAGALVGIVAVVAAVVPRSIAVADGGLASWDPSAVLLVLRSRFGAAALIHVTGLMLLLTLALPAPAAPVPGHGARPSRFGGSIHPRHPQADAPVETPRLERASCLAGGALVVGSYVLTGHPRASSPATLLVLAQCVHLVAVSTWFGGVVFLMFELRRLRRQGTAGDLARVVQRFSNTAMVTVLLAGATGVGLAASQLGSLQAITSTAYGRALVAKLGVLALPLALGAYNARRLVPAISRGEDRAWTRLRRTLTAEALLIALGVLLFTTAMVTGGIDVSR